MNRTSGYDPNTGICWQFRNKGDRDLRCKCPAHRQRGEERILACFGRCRSGRRWFWSAAIYLTDKETFGWADTEDEAMAAAMDTVHGFRTGIPILASLIHGWTSTKLKQINAAKRAARPPSDAKDSKVVEYLYGRSIAGEDTDRFPVRFRITKKTRKRVFYIRNAEWLDESGAPKRYNDGITIISDRDGDIGYVNRQKLEADGSVENRGVHWSDYDRFSINRSRG